jgi:hypothetical protein
MGPLAYIKSAVGIVTLMVIAGLLAWGMRVDHLREGWKARYGALSEQAGRVLASVRIASGNPKLKWEQTADQVEALDASLTEWRGTARTQSALIDTMGRDAARLRAENAALAEKVKALNAKRAALVARLSEDALEPGDRADCWAQLRATEDALNLLYREGF